MLLFRSIFLPYLCKVIFKIDQFCMDSNISSFTTFLWSILWTYSEVSLLLKVSIGLVIAVYYAYQYFI